MTSDLDIANSALSKLGQSPLTVFGQNQGTGFLLWTNYVQMRDSLLRTLPWNFAKRWINLVQLQNAPLGLDIAPNSASPGSIILTAAYKLPLDYLRLYRFSPRESHWRIVGDAIYTDAVPANNGNALLGLQPIGSDGPDNQPPSITNPIITTPGIEYIRRVENPNEFDPLFVETFIWKIAKDLSVGVSAWTENYKIAKAEYNDAIANAGAVNGMEQVPDEWWNSDLSDVRFGYSSVSGGIS